MATTLKTKNSVTTTVVPTSLAQGELAVNIADKKIWVGNASTTPVLISDYSGSIIGGSNTQVQYNNSGVFAGDADFTFNGTTVTMANDASISGLTVGKGGGSVARNTVVGGLAGGLNTTGTISAFGYYSLYNNTTGAANAAFGGNNSVVSAALQANTTGSYNSAFGIGALSAGTTAAGNSAVGYQALYNNTSSETTAMGYTALYSNTSGDYNNAFGSKALYSNTTGTENVAFGNTTLTNSTTGNYNTAIGNQSLRGNTTASHNTALGWASLYTNSTGTNNVAVGSGTLQNNTTGNNNTAVGYQAGYLCTTATQNVFVGQWAGYGAGTGGYNVAVGYSAGSALTSATGNVMVGISAGVSTTTGICNTFVGGSYSGYAGRYNTTGGFNTAIGTDALNSNTTANNNTVLGFQAGYTNQTGASNTFIGQGAGYNSVGSGGAGSNTFVGTAAGYDMTTGIKNTFIGRFQGNSGGLDARAANNLVVLSDGDGNVRQWFDNGGNLLIGRLSVAQSAKVNVNGSILATNSGVDGSYANAFIAQYSGNDNEANVISTQVGGNSGFRFECSNGGGSSARTTSLTVTKTSVAVAGSLSKGSGSFKIDHPLPELTDTHHLVHSFVEAPKADLIYRGRVALVKGKATVNIDESATMTEGTFVLLCREVQCFTTNESDWTPVRGSVSGNILTIESQDATATSDISWMVIGERKDKHMMDTGWTDDNGRVIVEPSKEDSIKQEMGK